MRLRRFFGSALALTIGGTAFGFDLPKEQERIPAAKPEIMSIDGGVTYSASNLYVAQQPPATGTRPPVSSAPTPGATPGTVPTPPRAPLPVPDNTLAQATPTSTFSMPSGASNTRPGYGLARTPHMIGDTLGPQFQFLERGDGGGAKAVGSVPLGGGNRSVKISEDTSPLPVDRVFFDYNNFHDALINANGELVDLNQYTFGYEKTFFDGMCSVQLKMPLQSGLNNYQDINATPEQNEGTSFGRLSITPKLLLHQGDVFACSIGMPIGTPTSPDAFFSSFTQFIRVDNESVHLAPFIGFLYAPSEKLFSITYLQLDFDLNGNAVSNRGFDAGRLYDPTLFYVDTSVGYWLFGGQPAQANYLNWVTGVAPMLEIHYTSCLQDVQGIPGLITPTSVRPNFLNLTAGVFCQLGRLTNVFVGGAVPLLEEESNREFESEFVVQFNRRF